MKESFDFDNERNLNNIKSFLEGVANTDMIEEHKLTLVLGNLKLLLDDAEIGLSRLYNLNKDYREDIYLYLSNKIISIRKNLQDGGSMVKNERLKLLEIFTDLVETQFGKKVKKDVPLSIKQKVLMLEYLDVLNHLKSNNQTQLAKIISLIADSDLHNTKEALRYNHRAVKADAYATKTFQNLQRVKKEFEDLGLSEIVNKIEADISEIK